MKRTDLRSEPVWKQLLLLLTTIPWRVLSLNLLWPRKWVLKAMIVLKTAPAETARFAVSLIMQGVFWRELEDTQGDLPDALFKWLGPRLSIKRMDYLALVAPHFERIGLFEGLFESELESQVREAEERRR